MTVEVVDVVFGDVVDVCCVGGDGVDGEVVAWVDVVDDVGGGGLCCGMRWVCCGGRIVLLRMWWWMLRRIAKQPLKMQMQLRWRYSC